MKENESTAYDNMWDIAKAVLRKKFIAFNGYIWNETRSQLSKLLPQENIKGRP